MADIRGGLIGKNISQSRYARGLSRMCEAHGLSLEFASIDTAQIAGFDFDATVDDLRNRGWTAVNVTHPHKPLAVSYARHKMGLATGLETSNLLLFSPQPAVHNTDLGGMLGAWRRVMGTQKPGRVLIAGAGGVGYAIAIALRELGATEILLTDTDPARATALANSVGPTARVLSAADVAGTVPSVDGLVNATPLGMTAYPGSAFDATLIGPQKWVFDAVYTPPRTTFIRAADDAGLSVITGFDLFCDMTILSFELISGLNADRAAAMRLLAPLEPTRD